MNERNKIEGVKEKRGKRIGPAGRKEKRGDNRRHRKVKEDKWRAQLTKSQKKGRGAAKAGTTAEMVKESHRHLGSSVGNAGTFAKEPVDSNTKSKGDSSCSSGCRKVRVIESDDTEDTKKAIEPPGDDGRYDPAKAGARRCSPIRSVVTRLGRNPMTSTTTTPDSFKDVEWSKRRKKRKKTRGERKKPSKVQEGRTSGKSCQGKQPPDIAPQDERSHRV